MAIERLLQKIAPAQFVERYFHKLPFAGREAAGAILELGVWSTVDALLRKPDADVLVVHRGEQRAEGPRSSAEAQLLCGRGYTVVVRHAERLDQRFADLARGFQEDFGGTVDIHVYCTGAGQYGFGWHYDAEDVFVVQTQGTKEYSLRKNTVHPWPVIDTLPANMCYEREVMPLLRCNLGPGDWLYVPAGYWHKAEAGAESISLAIGVLSPTVLHVLDFLRKKLSHSLRWRERLPVVGLARALNREELTERLTEMFKDLLVELGQQLNDPALRVELLQALDFKDEAGC